MKNVTQQPEREDGRRTKPANKRPRGAKASPALEGVVKDYAAKRSARTDAPAKLTSLQRRMQSGDF